MNKVLLIIEREYLSRVRKRSFLVATFLVPTLFIGMIVLVGFLTKQGGDVSTKIDVIDESGIFADKLKDEKPVDFSISAQSLADAKKKVINVQFVIAN